MANGELETGSTAHYMTEGFDDGPILAQQTFTIPAGATAFQVLRSSPCLGYEVACQGLTAALHGRQGQQQDSELRTYFSHPTRKAYREFRSRGYRLMRFRDGVRAIRETRRQNRNIEMPLRQA